jgi:hypothetical protein
MIVHYRPTVAMLATPATPAMMGLEHEVSLSSDYITSPSILCDGQPVTFATSPGRATFTCPVQDQNEHTFEVVGTPAQ